MSDDKDKPDCAPDEFRTPSEWAEAALTPEQQAERAKTPSEWAAETDAGGGRLAFNDASLIH